MTSRATMAAVAAALLLGLGCGQYVEYGGEGPQAQVEPAEPLGDFPQAERLGHYSWAGLVARFTSRRGDQVLLDYGALQSDEEGRWALRSYRAGLAGVDVAGLADAAERQAFWINAYNASVVAGVLEALDEGTSLESFSVLRDPQFFRHPAYTFGAAKGQEPAVVSLDHIEQGILRGDWEHDSLQGIDEALRERLRQWHQDTLAPGQQVVDARLHAALNCGALGCPNLLDISPYVYSGPLLDEQLKNQTRTWLADPTKGAGPRGVSQLFSWYSADFEREGGVEAFLEAHRGGGAGGVALDQRLDYDWALNAP